MATDALLHQVAAKWQESFTKINRNEPGITGLITYSQAWQVLEGYLRPTDEPNRDSKKDTDPHRLRVALDVVNQSRRLPALLEVYLESVRKKFALVRNDIQHFMQAYDETRDVAHVSNLIYRLASWCVAWAPPKDFGMTLTSSFALEFKTLLYSALPPSFARGFKALVSSTLSPDGSTTERPPPQDPKLWQSFELLGLLDRYDAVVASCGYEHIEKHVLETCTGEWTRPMLEELREWMSDKMVMWMILPYAKGATTSEEARALLKGIGSRFDFHMNKTLCDLRTKEIFDIIIDYPDSMGALQDLKECLQRVDQRSALVHSLRQANKKRLLHPGADTKLILQQYVATIKCLRIIDPPGVLLYKVADPIRRYLRERPDTIRSIVANLVGDDENGDSLVDENEPIMPLQQPDVEDYSDPNWEPEPIDAGPDFRANKPADVISTLVSIYDSKDLFVKELQVLLAQRLLAIGGDDTEKVERERRNIEILKIRFGEAALQVCEVMMKDMTDSKRTDTHIQTQNPSIIHPTIISQHFWPAMESSDIVMPGQFQELQKTYNQEFNVFKPDKRLRWLPHLGTVHLELQLDDRSVDADVPPLEAAFIELFSDRAIWTIDELIAGVGSVDRSAAVKALLTWVDLGVLKEDEEGVFRLLDAAEEPSAGPSHHTRAAASSVPEIATAPTTQQQQAEQMRVYWKFIEGMLTNLGTLSLDRIQSMLGFAPGYDRTVEQLSTFLEAARQERLVTVKDGMYALVK